MCSVRIHLWVIRRSYLWPLLCPLFLSLSPCVALVKTSGDVLCSGPEYANLSYSVLFLLFCFNLRISNVIMYTLSLSKSSHVTLTTPIWMYGLFFYIYFWDIFLSSIYHLSINLSSINQSIYPSIIYQSIIYLSLHISISTSIIYHLLFLSIYLSV